MPTIDVLSKNKKIITNFHLKIIFLIAVKKCNILHGGVFVMIFILSFLRMLHKYHTRHRDETFTKLK